MKVRFITTVRCKRVFLTEVNTGVLHKNGTRCRCVTRVKACVVTELNTGGLKTQNNKLL